MHAATSALVVGALKHKGVISLHPAVIKNESARYTFTQAVQLGEDAAVMAERFIEGILGEIEKKK